MTGAGAPNEATTLRRGLAILRALAEQADAEPLGVTRLARSLNVDKSQVSRTLKILTETGFAEPAAQGRGFRLGAGLLHVAARAADAQLLTVAGPVLGDLVGRTGETAHLAVLSGDQVVTLLSELPSSAIRAAGWAGRSVPALCTASGRALLLDHGSDAVARLAARPDQLGAGPNAPHDIRAVMRRIDEARQAGVAVAEEELEEGLVAVGAPVRDGNGRIVAACNVSGPAFRLGRRLPTASEAVRAAADAVSRGISGPAAPVRAVRRP